MDGSSMMIDDTIKDPCKDFPAMTNLLSSQRSAEVSLIENERRKRPRTRHNAVASNVNGSVVLEGRDFCQEENEGKEQNMLEKAAETSKAECDLQEVSSRPNLVVANAEHFVEESLSEVVNLNPEQSTNDDSFNPEDRSDYVKNVSMKKHDDCLVVYSVSQKFQNFKTYMRRQRVDSNYGRDSKNSSSVNYNKEPTMEGDNKDDLHKISDEPSAVGLVEKETEVLRDQVTLNGGGASEEMKLMKKHDGYPVVYHVSQRVNTNYGINSKNASSVNYNKEAIVEDDNKDDLHKISDEPSTAGLVEKETKVLRDGVTSNGDGASKEMKLMIKNANEKGFVTDMSVIDIPEVQLEENNDRKLDGSQITRHDMSSSGDVADLSLVSKKDDHSEISHFSLDRTVNSYSKKKLIVLDVNGLLADIVGHVPRGYKPDIMISRKSVFKRPFCDDFLKFCFEKFHVGIWSSRHKNNVDTVIEFLMGKSASKLLFCWNQSHCTETNFSTVENRDKPLVLKELRKVWEKIEPGLPWEKGEFNESNTLLLDDSPHKALLNPMNTAIFPYSYKYSDTGDSSLGPGGDLRAYLEGLAMAENVQEYVAANRFGQRAITESNLSWGYYRKVINSVFEDGSGKIQLWI